MKETQLFKKPLLCLFLILFFAVSHSQVTEEWVRRYQNIEDDQSVAYDVAVDSKGNVYVTGTSYNNETFEDYITVKYDPEGKELWARRYDGPGHSNDAAIFLVVDAKGMVYVTGYSTGTITGYDYTTIKYDTDGKELWVSRYNGPEGDYDEPAFLAIDGLGNVYVTGTSNDGEDAYDYATVKYDTNGKEQWVRRYKGSPNNYFDIASALAVDNKENVYVTGSCSCIGTTDFATIKYDADGRELWVRTFDGPDNGYDGASSIAVGASGNVYVTGFSSVGYATIKYNAEGEELWVRTYKNGGATALALDVFENVYVTGSRLGSNGFGDYTTLKYNTNGEELWVRNYNGPVNLDDRPSALAIDAEGSAYVTGSSAGIGPQDDFATIKYNAAGEEQWLIRYNGPANFHDKAWSLALEASGNVYITGSSYDSESSLDFTTIKYSQSPPLAAVTSFTLINTRKDEEVKELKDGDILDLASLPSLNLNIRANTSPDTVGSVRFQLSGAESRSHTENLAPYALFANNQGDYYPWIPPVGNYTLTATPYSSAKGGGEKGTPLIIHFTVVGSAVTSLVLVDAEKDKDLQVLRSGDVIDLSSVPTTKLNIRAVTNPATVGSVVFNLNNKVQVLENHPPYLIGGNVGSNYSAWTLPTGKHRLTATPYELNNAKGKKGVAHSVFITVVDKSSSRLAGAKQAQMKAVDEGKAGSLWVAPNPLRGQTTLSFSVPKSGYTTVEVYDMRGAFVERLFAAMAEEEKVYRVYFSSRQLPAGVYTARVVSEGTIHTTQLLMLK